MKNILPMLLVLLCLLVGCGTHGEEVLQVTPSPEAVVTVKTDAFGEYLASVEARSEAIKKSLSEDALTQHDMNMKSEELYILWDDALNDLWGELKKAMPEGEFAALTEEQLAWIEEKEAAVREAGAEFEGGSIYPLIVNGEASRITEERVYELYDLLKE